MTGHRCHRCLTSSTGHRARRIPCSRQSFRQPAPRRFSCGAFFLGIYCVLYHRPFLLAQNEAYAAHRSIQYSESILADLASMLLSNTSTELSTCKKLAELKVPVIRLPPGSSAAFYPTLSRAGSSPPPAPYPSGTAEDVLALPLLVQAFVQGAKIDASSAVPTRKGELHFLASVFANMSTVRPMFLHEERRIDAMYK